MHDVDRAILVVKPKRPYVQWASADGDDVTANLDDLRGDSVAYAVPCFEDEAEMRDVLRHCWSSIFEHELRSWDEDRAKWPQQRTFEMFLEWFDIEPHSLVLDIVP